MRSARASGQHLSDHDSEPDTRAQRLDHIASGIQTHNAELEDKVVMHRTCRVVVFLAIAAGVSTLDGALVVASRGVSDYSIVTPSEPSPSQAYAAEELQRFIQEMTGATLPVQSAAKPLPPKAIVIGATRHTGGLIGSAPSLASLGDDGFLIRTVDPHIVILGGPVRGTLYGVYELLETYGGCRWYASWHSNIPKHDQWTVPAIDDLQKPAFTMREPFWFDMFKGDFAVRCRANGNRMDLSEKHGGKIRFGAGLFVHTFYRLMPPAEFFDEHPEYYSEINGERTADHAQLCLTNPDVVRICTERMLQKIRQDPTAKLFSLSQNDWRNYCTCPKCRAIDEREGTPAGSLVHFVNQVAEAVEKEFPDVWIETLAYQYTRKPPKTLRPRHNVVPRLCTIECDFAKPLDVSTFPQNRTFVDEIRQWSAITDKLYIWDYTTNFGHYVSPHPNFGCLQGNVRFFRDNSVVGLFEQGAYQGRHAEFAELRAWILAKLLWNPDQDIEPLYEDFFNGYYGPGAPFVRQYFDALHERVSNGEHVLRIWSPPTSPWYSDEFVAQSADLWEKAEAAVRDNPRFSYNVRMGALPIVYTQLMRWPKFHSGHRWSDGKLVPEGVPAGYTALARTFLERFDEAGDIRICENADRHRQFISLLRGRTTGFEPVTIRTEGLQAAAVPEFGGRLCLLAGSAGNILQPDAGGVDSTISTGHFLGMDRTPYKQIETTPDKVVLEHVLRRRMRLRRTMALADGALSMNLEATSIRIEPQTIRPVIRTALNLGPAGAICWKASSEDTWTSLLVSAAQPFATTTILAEQLPEHRITLASPVTGRAVELGLPATALDRVLLLADPKAEAVRVFTISKSIDLPGRETRRVGVQMRPFVVQPGALPKVSVPESHRNDRITVQECFIPIGRRGTWGDYVEDSAATDKRAAKLYGTHYEWCMQWRFDPQWFDAGATYEARIRVRAEKSGTPGEAFWAGVYDSARKKSWGQIQPTVGEAGDGYAWYTIARWKPEPEQYIWVGPGRFDKKAKAPSAVKAVYIDCLELTKVE